MPAPAMNPWDQLTPEQQMSLVQKMQANLQQPNAGGAAGANTLATPLEQRMGGQPMPPGWPGAGLPVGQMPKNPNMGFPLGGQAAPAPPPPVRDYVEPQQAAAAAPPAGLPLYLPQQTVQAKKAAEPPLAVPYAPGHGPWDMQDPHATTSPGGGKSPADYVGQKDAGNPNGGQPPTSGNQQRGTLADAFGIPGMGMMNPRSMFKPAELAPRGTAPQNPLQAAGSPQSALPGGTPSLNQMGQNPAAIAQAQKNVLGNTMAEFRDPNYLAPVDPMTMIGKKSEAQAEQKQEVKGEASRAVPQTEYDTALQRLMQGTPGLNMMRQDLGHLQGSVGALLDREANAGPGSRVDLAPLMALSDTWFGGDLTKGYQRPTDRLKAVADFSKTLTGGEGQLSEAENNFLRTQLQDKLMSDLASGLTGSRQVTAGTGGGAGMMNPLEFLRFGEELRQHGIQNDRTDATAAGKYADEGGTAFAEVQRAMQGIDKLAHDYNGYNTNHLPGYYGNFHNPTTLFKDEAAKDLDHYIAVLTNQINHMDFGSRITNSEMQAQSRNLSTAQGQGPKQILKALRDYQAAVQKQLGAKFRSMTPEQQAKAKAAGALMPEDFNFTFGTEMEPPKPQKRAPVRAAGAPADDTMILHLTPKGTPDAPDMPASEAFRQGGSAASKTGGKTGTDIIPEASKDVDELRRQAKERARALGGK